MGFENMTPEQRKASQEKAAATRAAKKALAQLAPKDAIVNLAAKLGYIGTPARGKETTVDYTGHIVSDPFREKLEQEVWIRGLTTAMHTKEVKHATAVNDCVIIADIVLEHFKKKFPQ